MMRCDSLNDSKYAIINFNFGWARLKLSPGAAAVTVAVTNLQHTRIYSGLYFIIGLRSCVHCVCKL